MSFGLYYDANYNRHMPIWGEICRAERKYMSFFGAVGPSVGPVSVSAICGKMFKTREHKQMTQRCAVDFLRETRWVKAPRFGCFQDSRMRVKNKRILSLTFRNKNTTFFASGLYFEMISTKFKTLESQIFCNFWIIFKCFQVIRMTLISYPLYEFHI